MAVAAVSRVSVKRLSVQRTRSPPTAVTSRPCMLLYIVQLYPYCTVGQQSGKAQATVHDVWFFPDPGDLERARGAVQGAGCRGWTISRRGGLSSLLLAPAYADGDQTRVVVSPKILLAAPPPPRPPCSPCSTHPPKECMRIFSQTQVHFSAVKCFKDGRGESHCCRVQGSGYRVQGTRQGTGQGTASKTQVAHGGFCFAEGGRGAVTVAVTVTVTVTMIVTELPEAWSPRAASHLNTLSLPV